MEAQVLEDESGVDGRHTGPHAQMARLVELHQLKSKKIKKNNFFLNIITQTLVRDRCNFLETLSKTYSCKTPKITNKIKNDKFIVFFKQELAKNQKKLFECDLKSTVEGDCDEGVEEDGGDVAGTVPINGARLFKDNLE